MRGWQVEDGFGLDNLRPVERPRPQPGPGEILLRVEAVSLNYRDLMMVEGLYNPRQPLPLVPCSDAVGTIEGVGEGVREWSGGERVCTTMTPDWIAGSPRRDVIRSTLGGPLDGTLQEHMVLPGHGVVRCPSHLEAVEGATLVVAGLTAWNCLVTFGGLRPGGVALILGTGGVSVFALQLADLLGARAIVTSSSDEKLERARQLGAWRTINYVDVPEWGRAVQELTEGAGADVVVEVGGAGTLPQSIRAAALGATISLVGVVAGGAGRLDVVPIFMRQLRVQGVLVGHRESFEALNRAVEAAELRPVVDRVFGFDEAPEAFAYLKSARHFGKVCIGLS